MAKSKSENKSNGAPTVTVERKVLAQAVKSCGYAVTGRMSLPVLQNVALEGQANNKLRLTGCDLEIQVQATVQAQQADKAFGVTVPPRLLSEWVGTSQKENIVIEQWIKTVNSRQQLPDVTPDEKVGIKLSDGDGDCHLHGLPLADFTPLPDTEGVNLTLPGKQLCDLVEQTIFACSSDETRLILTGALVSVLDGKLTFAATDTHRIAVASSNGLPKNLRISHIVPQRALAALLRTAKGAPEVACVFGEKQAEFAFAVNGVDYLFTCRVIEGQFPQYEKFLELAHESHYEIGAKEFAKAVKRLLIIAREDANRVFFKPAKNALVLSAESADVGKGQEVRVEAKIEGNPPEFALNARYALETTLAVPEGRDELRLSLAGPLNPIQFNATGETDWTVVTMPMGIL